MAEAVTVTLSWSTVTLAASVLTALGVIVGYIAKGVRFMDRQKQQDAEIDAIYEELTLLTFGVRACLRGLQEQGCNGPVTEALNLFDKHLNKKAHEHGGANR